MKITSVYIEQFGQFSNQHFEFPQHSFLVIQGQNEAGKTTLAHFIKYMLLGFPSRHQLKSSGYAGEHEAKIGGRLNVQLSNEESLSIVRHLRKENGRAKLYFSNGEIQDERLLQEWLKGMDLSLYNAIFSLDLDGLQNLHKLKPDTLQHYLFSTGMTGNSKVLELERKLEKEVGDRFKPNGTKPPINQTLIQLQETGQKLQVWERKLDDYDALKEKQVRLLNQLTELDRERHKRLEAKQDFIEYHAIEPSLIKCQSLKKELAAFPNSLDQFPIGGKARYEAWRTQVVTLESEKAGLEAQREQLEADREHLDGGFDDRWLILSETIRRHALDEASIEGEAYAQIRLEEKRKYEEEGLQRIGSQIGISWDSDPTQTIKAIDTGLDVKQKLKLSLQDLQQLDQEMVFIRREWTKLKQDLEEVQDPQRAIDFGLSDEALNKAEALYTQRARSDVRSEEMKWLNRDIQTAKERNASINKILQFSFVLPLIGILIGMGFVISRGAPYSSVTTFIEGSIWILFFVSLTIWFRRFLKKFQTALTQLKEWKQRRSELEEEEREIQAHDALLQQYERYLFEHGSRLELDKSRESLEKTLSARQFELREIEALKEDREAGLHTFLRTKGYPIMQDLSIALEMVQLIEKAKEKVSLIEELEGEIKTKRDHIETIQTRFHSLQERLDQPDATLKDLLSKLENMEEIDEARIQNEQADALLKKQCASLDERIARFKKECYNLWQQAGVTSEEEFYEREAQYIKKQECLKAYEEARSTLETLVPELETLERYMNGLNEGIWRGVTQEGLEMDVSTLDRERQALLSQIEDDRVALRHIEEDEQHPELVHKMERLKAKLNQEAHEWSVYKVALGLLSQAKNAYKENRLPKLLDFAQTYFKRLTNNAYSALYYQEEDGFTVEHTDGAIYKAEELSRGTAEQLYVSIRLGFIQLFDGALSLPLLVDDGFVNFDENRTEEMLTLLRELSHNRQVLLLTCRNNYEASIRMEDWKENGRKVVY